MRAFLLAALLLVTGAQATPLWSQLLRGGPYPPTWPEAFEVRWLASCWRGLIHSYAQCWIKQACQQRGMNVVVVGAPC